MKKIFNLSILIILALGTLMLLFNLNIEKAAADMSSTTTSTTELTCASPYCDGLTSVTQYLSGGSCFTNYDFCSFGCESGYCTSPPTCDSPVCLGNYLYQFSWNGNECESSYSLCDYSCADGQCVWPSCGSSYCLSDELLATPFWDFNLNSCNFGIDYCDIQNDYKCITVYTEGDWRALCSYKGEQNW